MPLRLLPEKSWSRDYATAALTDAGRESVITRLEEDRNQNGARWLKNGIICARRSTLVSTALPRSSVPCT